QRTDIIIQKSVILSTPFFIFFHMFFQAGAESRSRARHYVRPFTGPAGRPESPGGIRRPVACSHLSPYGPLPPGRPHTLASLRPDRVLSPASDPGARLCRAHSTRPDYTGHGARTPPLPGGTTSPHLPSSGPRRHRSRTDIPGCRRPPGRRPLQPAGTN
ncbi:Tripartite tricarboxylate transporter TctB family, partial [Dysosmobacter welbionis]